MVNIEKLVNDSLLIGRDGIIPQLSGNMAFNAYRGQITPTGFRLVILETIAPYAEFVDRDQDFWNTLRNAIASHITAEVNGHRNNLNATRERVAKLSPDNPARQATLLKSLQSTLKEF